MKLMQRVLSLTCLFVLLSAAALAQNAPLTVLVVRHAEKATDDPTDPNLSEAGRQRAQDLVNAAAAAEVSAIYTTQYKRTQQTAQPLADRLHLTLTKLEVTKENSAGYGALLAKELRTKHAGHTVLVVGHSNSVPQIVEALSGTKIPPFDEATEFNRLLVVIVPKKGQARVIQARYGK